MRVSFIFAVLSCLRPSSSGAVPEQFQCGFRAGSEPFQSGFGGRLGAVSGQFKSSSGAVSGQFWWSFIFGAVQEHFPFPSKHGR